MGYFFNGTLSDAALAELRRMLHGVTMTQKLPNPYPIKATNMVKENLALLGTQMKDRVTGFSGMVSSVSFDAYGCIQVILTPPVGKDGKPQDGHWFDAKRLVAAGKRLMPQPDFGVTPEAVPGGFDKPLPPEQPRR